MKRLYLVRHGIAVDHADPAGPDGSRPLTGKGRRRFARAARAFEQHLGKLDLILTSPLVRAVQTAEILAAATDHREVAVLEELHPGVAAATLFDALAGRAGKARAVALVGHEPQLSSVLAALANLPAAQAAQLDFKKGAIVRLDMIRWPAARAAASAEARWWLKPRGARAKGLPLKKLKKGKARTVQARPAK
ncbi:MAG: histidine phosphatase family protein [Myxococcales bacterium]